MSTAMYRPRGTLNLAMPGAFGRARQERLGQIPYVSTAIQVAQAAKIGFDLFGRKKRASREPQEISRASTAVDADISKVLAATTPLVLAQAVRDATHQALGGPLGRGTNPDTAGFAVFLSNAPPPVSVGLGTAAGVTDLRTLPGLITFGAENSGVLREGALGDFSTRLLIAPDSFFARILLGVNNTAKDQINQPFEAAVRDQAKLMPAPSPALLIAPVSYAAAPAITRAGMFPEPFTLPPWLAPVLYSPWTWIGLGTLGLGLAAVSSFRKEG